MHFCLLCLYLFNFCHINKTMHEIFKILTPSDILRLDFENLKLILFHYVLWEMHTLFTNSYHILRRLYQFIQFFNLIINYFFKLVTFKKVFFKSLIELLVFKHDIVFLLFWSSYDYSFCEILKKLYEVLQWLFFLT